MSETSETLAFFTQGWQNYQDQLSIALARLSPEQLALRAAPDLRSIDELARHVIAVRAGWFHYNLEEGDEDFGAFNEWYGPGSLPRSADELVSGLKKPGKSCRRCWGAIRSQICSLLSRMSGKERYTPTPADGSSGTTSITAARSPTPSACTASPRRIFSGCAGQSQG